jgi:hypothetical protein
MMPGFGQQGCQRIPQRTVIVDEQDAAAGLG